MFTLQFGMLFLALIIITYIGTHNIHIKIRIKQKSAQYNFLIILL